MKVRAKERGYYGRLIEPGEVFDFPGNKKLGSWMEPVKNDPAPATVQGNSQGDGQGQGQGGAGDNGDSLV